MREEIRAEQRRRNEQLQHEQLQPTLDKQMALKEAELEKLARFEDMAQRLERAARLRALGAALEAPKALRSDEVVAQWWWLRDAADWLGPTVRRHGVAVDDAEVLWL